MGGKDELKGRKIVKEEKMKKKGSSWKQKERESYEETEVRVRRRKGR